MRIRCAIIIHIRTFRQSTHKPPSPAPRQSTVPYKACHPMRDCAPPHPLRACRARPSSAPSAEPRALLRQPSSDHVAQSLTMPHVLPSLVHEPDALPEQRAAHEVRQCGLPVPSAKARQHLIHTKGRPEAAAHGERPLVGAKNAHRHVARHHRPQAVLANIELAAPRQQRRAEDVSPTQPHVVRPQRSKLGADREHAVSERQ